MEERQVTVPDCIIVLTVSRGCNNNPTEDPAIPPDNPDITACRESRAACQRRPCRDGDNDASSICRVQHTWKSRRWKTYMF
jgi:hypothetical protein